MKRGEKRLLAAIILSWLNLSPARSEGPFSYRFKPGPPVSLGHDLSASVTLTSLGLNMEGSGRLHAESSLRVLSVDKQGVAGLELILRRVSGSVKAPMFGEFAWDSKSPVKPADSKAAWVWSESRAWVGKRFLLRVDSWGRVLNVSSPDEPEVSKDNRNSRNIAQSLFVLLPEPYPRPGQTWTPALEAAPLGGGEFRVTLQSLAGGTATLRLDAELKTPLAQTTGTPGPDSGALAGPVSLPPLSSVKGSGSGSGVAVYSAKDGLPLSAKGQVHGDFISQAGDSGTSSSTRLVFTVDFSRSRLQAGGSKP